MNHSPKALIIVSVLLVLTACEAPPPANQGRSGARVDPSHDSPAEVGSLDLRSKDLVTATDMMAQDIASRLDIADAKSPPRIFVGEIENKTTSRHQNYQVFVARLRSVLNASKTRHGLEFVRERAFVEAQRDREYGTTDPANTASNYQSAADYVLTCEVYDLPAGGTNYYLLDYQLVQLRDAATGPDVGAGAIVWENSYEVKFQE